MPKTSLLFKWFKSRRNELLKAFYNEFYITLYDIFKQIFDRAKRGSERKCCSWLVICQKCDFLTHFITS